MNSRYIKIIAALTMVVDHVGYMLFPQIALFRIIGRISMPLFCLLIAYGATKTRSQLKYVLRLFICALIFQAFYNIFYEGSLFVNTLLNVFFTLSLGAFAIYLLKQKKLIFYILCPLLLVFPLVLKMDYGLAGLILIVVLYFAFSCGHKAYLAISTLALIAFALIQYFYAYYTIQFFSLLALVPYILFKDEKLKITKFERWAFYAFYPLHMIAIYAVSLLL